MANSLGIGPFAQPSRPSLGFATGMALYLVAWYSLKEGRLAVDNLDPNFVKLGKKRILIGPVAYLLAIALSFASTQISLVIYVIVPFIYILPGTIDIHWSRQGAAEHA